ncbi:hypothetical protein F5Y15DRAFT_414572 [Xylariaceae sp. FL0016]|nr:hypothetical protein F5Y15DRAFT_414572 [Xylariaceae sp. FL0016]
MRWTPSLSYPLPVALTYLSSTFLRTNAKENNDVCYEDSNWCNDSLSLHNYGTRLSAPWGINNTLFTSIVGENTNATGRYPLSTPDTSTPYSESGSNDTGLHGWAWDIQVSANVPVSDTQVPERFDTDALASFFTGVEITLQAPSAAAVDSSWDVCIIEWQINSSNADDLREDDGTCSSVLSQECRDGMADAVAAAWQENSDAVERCQCPDLRSIDACGSPPAQAFNSQCTPTHHSGHRWPKLPAYTAADIKNGTFLDTNNDTVAGPVENSTSTPLLPDELLVRTYGGDFGSRDNVTRYDQTGSIGWPYMVVWGSLGDAYDVPRPTSQLTCVRARNATDGSQAPGTSTNITATDGDDSAGALHGQKSYTVVFAGWPVAVWMALA